MKWNGEREYSDEVCCDIPLGRLCLFKPLNENRICFAHMAGMVVDDFTNMTFMYVLKSDNTYYFSKEVAMYSNDMRTVEDAEKYFQARMIN